MRTLGKVRDLWNDLTLTDAKDVAEVAMIVDADSTYYINQFSENTPKMNLGTRNKLNRLGAPYEVYSFSDIPKIKDFDRYKLVIFTSLFNLTPEKRRILDKYVLKNGRRVLWLYAPGIITDGKLNTENCKILSGIDYHAEGIVRRDMEGFTSYYVHSYDDLTPAVLKEIATDAGVLINTEEELPVYAEGDLLAIHTKGGGDITVAVDRKYSEAEELFTGRHISIVCGRFTYDFSSPDTALFRLK